MNDWTLSVKNCLFNAFSHSEKVHETVKLIISTELFSYLIATDTIPRKGQNN